MTNEPFAQDLGRHALDLLARSGLLAVAVERDGVLLHASDRFREMFALGVASAPRVALSTLVAEADRARVDRALAELSAGGVARVALVFGARRPDGSTFVCEAMAIAGELPGGPAIVLLASERASSAPSSVRPSTPPTLGEPSVPPAPAPFLPWCEAYEVGVAIIDEQHHVLVDLVNEVADELRKSSDRDTVLASLRSLMRFTAEHFATEERIMYEHGGGAGEEQHRKEHRKLFQDVRTLMLGIEARGPSETMGFLRSWLLEHIEHADRPFGEWLRGRGVR